MKKTIVYLLIIMGLFTSIGLYQDDKSMLINSVNNMKYTTLDTSINAFPMIEEPGEGLPK